MKKLLAIVFSLMLLFSFALAEEAEISLGALLHHESAVLFDGNGIHITVNEILQSGPEFFMKADCINENEFPIQILFTLPDQTSDDPFFSFRLNGLDYYAASTSSDENGNPYSSLYLPANGETVSRTIIIDPVEIPQDGSWLNLKDITEGAFCLTAYMPPEEESKDTYVPWPVFFVVEQIRFNMSYENSSLSDPVNVEIPPLESFADGTPFFSVSGVTLTCQDAFFDMDMTVFRPAMMGHAVLRNDTDQEFTFETYDITINDRNAGPFTLQPGDGSSLFPAHSETICDFSLVLSEGMMPPDVTNISLVLCCKDPATGNNLLYQPLIMTITQP